MGIERAGVEHRAGEADRGAFLVGGTASNFDVHDRGDILHGKRGFRLVQAAVAVVDLHAERVHAVIAETEGFQLRPIKGWRGPGGVVENAVGV